MALRHLRNRHAVCVLASQTFVLFRVPRLIGTLLERPVGQSFELFDRILHSAQKRSSIGRAYYDPAPITFPTKLG